MNSKDYEHDHLENSLTICSITRHRPIEWIVESLECFSNP